MHAVVDQMIDHLTQYWIVYFSVICKWCDDWWNNSSWYKSHCFFLLVVAIFFGLNDLVICFNFCSLILDKELCDKQFQYTNARHDHRYGRLASNLVFQFCQSEHSVEYPESTVIEVGEGNCSYTTGSCEQDWGYTDSCHQWCCQGCCCCDCNGCRSESDPHKCCNDERDQNCRK